MEKFYIDFNTGAGNENAETLEEAKKIAIDGVSYTQEPVFIYIVSDGVIDSKTAAILPWYGVSPREDDIVLISYGDFGFYGDWI